jgi:TonB family protein
MRAYYRKDSGFNWKTGVAALIVSWLVHQFLFFLFALFSVFDEPEKDEEMEISLVERKTQPAEPKKTEPETRKKKKLKPETKKRLRPEKPEKRPEPAPEKETVPEPEVKPQRPPRMDVQPTTEPEPSPPSPAKLKTELNWKAFKRTLKKKAEQDRMAYRDKLMKKRGGVFKFGKMSIKVQKALHNHRSWIRGAPKEEATAARTQLFRNYLEATHDNIHTFFAESFLPSLVSLGSSHPLNDFTLRTVVEFQILKNGVINGVHVVETSGLAMFDAGAVDSLYRASPFLPPPEKLLSYDNRVYFRWGFYRNQRKCGTFNATGYILKGPASRPTPVSEEDYTIIDG